MDQAEDSKAKRRLQNRISQRRFRNRQKGNASLANINPTAFEGNFETASISSWNTTGVAYGSSDVLAPDPALMTPELQKFFEEFDADLSHTVDASEETLFDILTPISLSSTYVGDSSLTRATDQDYGLNYTPIEQSGIHFTSPVPSQPGNNPHVPSVLPDSTSPITGASHHPTPPPNSVLMESVVAQSGFRLPRTCSTTHQPNVAQTDIEKSRINFKTADRGKITATCCVAHMAEAMVSEVEELCQFGSRFGLLEKDDNGDVEECLRYLKTRLHEAARCAEIQRSCK